jgi:molecular chaperone GrpE
MFDKFKKSLKNMKKNFTENELKKKNPNHKSDKSLDDEQEVDLKDEVSSSNENHEKIIESLKKENADLKEKIQNCLYTLASKEDDLRKMKNDIENQGKFVLQKFIKSTGPSIDDLMRILNKSDDNALKMVFSKLLKAFEENKIVISMPEVGDKFDPEIHNAISSVSDPKLENGVIAASMSGSYSVYGTSVLNAMVVVNNKEE